MSEHLRPVRRVSSLSGDSDGERRGEEAGKRSEDGRLHDEEGVLCGGCGGKDSWQRDQEGIGGGDEMRRAGPVLETGRA